MTAACAIITAAARPRYQLFAIILTLNPPERLGAAECVRGQDEFPIVMPGLVPGIHALLCSQRRRWPGHGRAKRRRSSNGCARPWRRWCNASGICSTEEMIVGRGEIVRAEVVERKKGLGAQELIVGTR